MSQIVTDLGARHKHKSRINQKNFGKKGGFGRSVANRSRIRRLVAGLSVQPGDNHRKSRKPPRGAFQ